MKAYEKMPNVSLISFIRLLCFCCVIGILVIPMLRHYFNSRREVDVNGVDCERNQLCVVEMVFLDFKGKNPPKNIKEAITRVDNVIGSSYLFCPSSNTKYILNPDGKKWKRPGLFAHEIACYCSAPHGDLSDKNPVFKGITFGRQFKNLRVLPEWGKSKR